MLEVEVITVAYRLVPADFLGVHVPVIALMRRAVLIVLIH